MHVCSDFVEPFFFTTFFLRLHSTCMYARILLSHFFTLFDFWGVGQFVTEKGRRRREGEEEVAQNTILRLDERNMDNISHA